MAYLGRRGALAPVNSAAIPDNSITAAKIVAGAVDADIGDNAVTLAKMAGGTDGQILTYDASGDPVAVGPGTAGQVIVSAGAGAPPTFTGQPRGTISSSISSTTNGSYTQFTYTADGTFTIAGAPLYVHMLVVGGGGGGGNNGGFSTSTCGGGAGGGGVVYFVGYLPIGAHTVTVGAGGAVGAATGEGGQNNGSNGANSS